MKITFPPSSDGGGKVFEIDTSVVPNLPEGNLASDEPPLTIQAVLSIALKDLQSEAQAQSMKLASIRLSSATVVGSAIVWYYSVTFVNDAKHRRDGFIERTINILVDGSVIKPRKISREEYGKWFK